MRRTNHCISLFFALCATLTTAAQSVELDANGDAKPGSNVPYRSDFQSKISRLRKQSTDSISLNQLTGSTDTAIRESDECDLSDLTYALDRLRVRYVNNMLYRAFDMALYRDGMNEFSKITTPELLAKHSAVNELLADYRLANSELLSFMEEIQAEQDRVDRAGAKIWAIRNLERLKQLPAYRGLRRGTYSNKYLINLTSNLEQRLMRSRDKSEVVDLSDIIKVLNRSAERRQIVDNSNNFTSQLSSGLSIENDIVTSNAKETAQTVYDKPEEKVDNTSDKLPISRDRRKIQAKRPAEMSNMTECEIKRYALNEDIDRLRFKYGNLMLTKPYDANRVNGAIKELSEVKNPTFVKRAEAITRNLRFYEAADRAVRAAVTAAQQSARESEKYDSRWYDKTRQAFNDTPAVRQITDGTYSEPFLSMIIEEFNSLLDKGVQQQAPAMYIPFERLLNEMKPIE